MAAVTLAGGFLLKDQCVGVVLPPGPYDGTQYRRSCYSDVFVLYFVRGLREEPVPYVHGNGVLDVDAAGNESEVGDLEYPAGTGVIVAAAAEASRDAVRFFALSAAILGAAGLVSVGLLVPLAADRRRLLLFAGAPSVVLYAFHNWDLAAVALACGALYAFRARADRAAAVLVGLGASVKLFPALLLAAFVLARVRETRRVPWSMAAWAAGAFAAVNLPFAVLNWRGFWFPWSFQSTRPPNYETHWYFLTRHLGSRLDWFRFEDYGSRISRASLVLLAAGVAALLAVEWRRARVRPYALAFGLVLVFLLTAKVFSPQYALWVLPFFVLLEIPWYGFAAFAVTEAATWFAVSAYDLNVQYGVGSEPFRFAVLEAATLARYAVLAWLLWRSRRAAELVA